MSLEALTAATDAMNALTETISAERGRIAAAADQAIEDLNGTGKTILYVDQDNGNDTFEGSLESPLKSIEEAIARGFSPGWLKINLLSDYHMDSVVQLNPGFHEIVSSDANAVRRITFADRVDNTDTRSPRFNSSTQMTSYRFSGIRFVAQQMAGHISNFGMIASHGVTSVLLQSCEFELPAGSNQTFLTLSNLMSLMVQNTTYPSEMAGRWVQGVAADTDPLTIRQMAATNLSSL